MGQLLVASLERTGALETSRDERGRCCDDRRAVSCGVSSADCLESVSGLRRLDCRLGNPVFTYVLPAMPNSTLLMVLIGSLYSSFRYGVTLALLYALALTSDTAPTNRQLPAHA